MVTYAHAHYVFRIHGHFGSTALLPKEQWSTGFRLGLEQSDVPMGVSLAPFLETVAPAIQAFHVSGGTKSGTKNFLSALTIARVGTDGKYDPSAQVTERREYTTKPPGVSIGLGPWSQSMVISLRTSKPRGIGSNGRTYWPCPGMPVLDTTGRVAPNDMQSFITDARTMVNAISLAAFSQIAAGVSVIVAGAAGKTGPAVNEYVNALRCDDRLDSIERRENDQPSSWYTLSL